VSFMVQAMDTLQQEIRPTKAPHIRHRCFHLIRVVCPTVYLVNPVLDLQLND
jgi:hypothetical protein